MLYEHNTHATAKYNSTTPYNNFSVASNYKHKRTCNGCKRTCSSCTQERWIKYFERGGVFQHFSEFFGNFRKWGV